MDRAIEEYDQISIRNLKIDIGSRVALGDCYVRMI
jgi:hypothetical protein